MSKQALPFKRANSFLAYPEDLYLEERPGHKHYDTRVHLPPEDHVVKGIMRDGVHLPVCVEKCGNLPVVTDGRQRVINAREANKRLVEAGGERIMIPVVPKRGDASKLMRLTLVTNKHRRAETPVSEAHKIAQYMDLGHNEEDVAELLGCTIKTVQNRLKLLDLCPEAQAALETGKITQAKALALCNKSFDEQKEALEPKPPRPPKPRKPSRALVAKIVESNGSVSDQVKAALLFARGEITQEEAAKRIKGLDKILQS